MKHAIGSSFSYVVLFTVAAAGVYGFAPSVRSLTLHAYVLAIGGAALMAAARIAQARAPRQRSTFDAALARKRRPPGGVSQLERMERAVVIGCASEADFRQHLLPQLREIAQAQLERSGRTSGPDTLGRWWDVLRPDREAPVDKFAPGISLVELRELTNDLDRLS
jgi:hypothetical protein